MEVTGPLGFFSSLRSPGGEKLSKSSSDVGGKSATVMACSGTVLFLAPPIESVIKPYAIRFVMLTGSRTCRRRILWFGCRLRSWWYVSRSTTQGNRGRRTRQHLER
eukprot:12934296-Heterocapsa_arctica.AAC.2